MEIGARRDAKDGRRTEGIGGGDSAKKCEK
jgi:hypothetical protein